MQSVTEMPVKAIGPLFVFMAAETSSQGVGRNTRFLACNTADGPVNCINMASSAAWHVLAKFFRFTIFGDFAVNTVVDLSVV
ncbi:MAG: hypothetical protein KJ985_05105 [Proteobacteria bacterium]|jgi:hypothetical protein|nr:hypothetical protein [Pseudomonadota bacterium]